MVAATHGIAIQSGISARTMTQVKVIAHRTRIMKVNVGNGLQAF